MKPLAVLGVVLALCACGAALAQPACRVHDPELQGSYRGECRNGFAEGYGEARGTAEYRGEFRAGRKHGKGTKTWPNGDRYEGAFIEDRKEGVGTYTWGPSGPAAGERYRGTYRADRRHGFGIYTWPSGDRYEGEWADDAIVGPPTAGMIARARQEKESEVAMVRSARVCRQVVIGIAERDLLKGIVVDSRPGEIAVRIEEPGRFENLINGVPVSRGTIVWDAVKSWAPCA